MSSSEATHTMLPLEQIQCDGVTAGFLTFHKAPFALGPESLQLRSYTGVISFPAP